MLGFIMVHYRDNRQIAILVALVIAAIVVIVRLDLFVPEEEEFLFFPNQESTEVNGETERFTVRIEANEDLTGCSAETKIKDGSGNSWTADVSIPSNLTKGEKVPVHMDIDFGNTDKPINLKIDLTIRCDQDLRDIDMKYRREKIDDSDEREDRWTLR